MKKKQLLFAILCIPFLVLAQDDLLSEIDNNSVEVTPTIATFKGLKVVNFESAKLVAKKELTLVIAHRFGSLKNGIDTFFGLDDAVTRINFIYGLTNNINVSVSRSSFQKIYEAAIKYKILQQEDNGFPLTLVGYNSILVNTAVSYTHLTLPTKA